MLEIVESGLQVDIDVLFERRLKERRHLLVVNVNGNKQADDDDEHGGHDEAVRNSQTMKIFVLPGGHRLWLGTGVDDSGFLIQLLGIHPSLPDEGAFVFDLILGPARLCLAVEVPMIEKCLADALHPDHFRMTTADRADTEALIHV